MKKGFTLLEMMVASMLLGMLVTTLTMLFNSSSVAWRTGTAGVVELKNTRSALGTFHDIEDDLLPGLGDKNVSSDASRSLTYRTVSVWKEGQDNKLRTDRAFDNSFSWGKAPQISMSDAQKGAKKSLDSAGSGQQSGLYTVGVRSAGPDGKWDTADDISTWPDQID